MAAAQPKYYPQDPSTFQVADDSDLVLPVVMMNIYGTCNCDCSGGPVGPECRSPQVAAQNVVGQIRFRYEALPPAKQAAFLENLTLLIYNVGTPAEGDGQIAPYGPGTNPTSLYSHAESLVIGPDSEQWPAPDPRRWLTPWFDSPLNSNVAGGLQNAKQWFQAFVAEYQVRINDSNLPAAVRGKYPKLVAFDTEFLPYDTGPNGAFALRQMAADSRWSTLMVPGSEDTAHPLGRTMQQLWTEYVDEVQSANVDGMTPCGGGCYELSQFVSTNFGFYQPLDGINNEAILRNRRVGAWYARVAKMAFNAAMKEAFFDVIPPGWNQPAVFNYGDVAIERRLNRMDAQFDERMGIRVDRSDPDQWSIQLSGRRLLGVPNVYKYALPATELPPGVPSSNPLLDVAAFPEYLYPNPNQREQLPDRWSFDSASLRENGKDLPGTHNCPVFYGRWVGPDLNSNAESPIDAHKPWYGWPAVPTDPYVGPNPGYWESGALASRDVLDSLFFSDQSPQSIIPWVPAATVMTFPNDGLDFRPATPAAALDLIDMLALVRAAKISDVMVFVHDPSSTNGSVLHPQYEQGVPGVPAPGADGYDDMVATYDSAMAEWKGFVEARRRVFGPSLVGADTLVVQGTHLSPCAALVSEAISSIVPDGKSHIASQRTHSAFSWKIGSESAPVTTIDVLEGAEGPGGGVGVGSVSQAEEVVLRCAFEISQEVPAALLSQSAPTIYLDAQVVGELDPLSVVGWFEVKKPQVPASSVEYERCRMLTEPSDRDIIGAFTPSGTIPPNTFGFYTNDQATRRTFRFQLTHPVSYYMDSARKVVVRLVVRTNTLAIPANSKEFTLMVDRLQMALGNFTGGASGSAGISPTEGGALIAPSADVNHDGTLDGNDVTVFVQNFAADTNAADVNDDGAVNEGDVEEFVQQVVP